MLVASGMQPQFHVLSSCCYRERWPKLMYGSLKVSSCYLFCTYINPTHIVAGNHSGVEKEKKNDKERKRNQNKKVLLQEVKESLGLPKCTEEETVRALGIFIHQRASRCN